MANTVLDAIQFEQRFWLQIMGDHARFIYFTLAPSETGEISKAQSFISAYDNLLASARQQPNQADAVKLLQQASLITDDFKAFKLHLLSLTLSSKLKIGLSSTFFNHMINELEEYETIINILQNGKILSFNPMHYHLLWLSDAIGHAAGVSSNLDEVEKDYIDNSKLFEKRFTDLYIKADNLNGYMRTGLESFPSMERLNMESSSTMQTFKEFLVNLRDARKSGFVLGTLLPLMADHMSREECYYLLKLSQSARNVSVTDCDPIKPRTE